MERISDSAGRRRPCRAGDPTPFGFPTKFLSRASTSSRRTDVVILGDVGSDAPLLAPETFVRSG